MQRVPAQSRSIDADRVSKRSRSKRSRGRLDLGHLDGLVCVVLLWFGFDVGITVALAFTIAVSVPHAGEFSKDFRFDREQFFQVSCPAGSLPGRHAVPASPFVEFRQHVLLFGEHATQFTGR